MSPGRPQSAPAIDAERLLRALPHTAVVAWDRDLRCTLAAGEALRRHGYEPSRMEGVPLAEALPPPAVDAWLPHCRAALDGSRAAFLWRTLDGAGHYELAFAPIDGEGGAIEGGVLTARDVTDRVAVEAELRASEEQHRLITENATDMITRHEVTPERRITFASGAARRLFGYDPADLVGRTASEVLHPDDLARIDGALHEEPSDGLVTNELRFRRADGAYVWAETTARVVRRDGAPVAIHAVTRDVSQRKATEAALDRAIRRLDRSFDDAPIGMALAEPDGRWTRVNRALAEMLGRPAEEIVGRTTHDFTHPDDREATRDLYVAALRHPDARHRLVKRYVRDDGTIVWADLALSVIRDAEHGTHCVVQIVDVTGRRKAERALRRAERRFRTAFEGAPIGMALVALDGTWLAVNRALTDILGRPEHALLATTFQAVTHPDDVDADVGLLAELVDGERPSYDIEKRYLRPDGTAVWVDLSVSLVRDEDGEPLHCIAQVQDVSERRRGVEALRASEERHRSVVSALSEGIVLQDAEGRIVTANDATARILQTRVEDLIGTTNADHEGVLIQEDGTPFPAEDQPSAVTLRTGVALTGVVIGLLRDDGTRWLSVNSQPLLAAGEDRPAAVVTSVSDITDLRAALADLETAKADLERWAGELQRSNRDLEHFAYVASHDMSEPLRVMSGYAELLRRRYAGALDERGERYVASITDGARRMQELLDSLLAYSRVRTRPLQPRLVDAGAALDDTLEALGGTIAGRGATITRDPLPPVEADPARLRQLLQNLVGNAIKFGDATAPAVHVGAQDAGAAWRFSVRDNGIGIEPQFRERVFGLFERLHTREEYDGTGLGLAICKQIVEGHGGRIWVDDAPGGGSTFWFTLLKPAGAA